MSSAVVYYSLEGNTRLAATELAERLGADLYEVRSEKKYPRKGLGQFLSGGKDAMFGALPKIEPLDVDLTTYDLVVLAFPLWAGKAAAPINTFLEGRKFGNARVAMVVCSASGDGGSCAKDLSARIGRSEGDIAELDLQQPSKMAKADLSAKLDGFAKRIETRAGGAF
ncbi:MAG: hypothetical protein IKE22_04695 [Atopobiaceae bacterium]|nr:hypothetical protein [Atopobiaceae bacterium]